MADDPEDVLPDDDRGSEEPTIESAPLQPIRFVERELTRPDGTKVRVEVPVYPPFKLELSAAKAVRGRASKKARSGGG